MQRICGGLKTKSHLIDFKPDGLTLFMLSGDLRMHGNASGWALAGSTRGNLSSCSCRRQAFLKLYLLHLQAIREGVLKLQFYNQPYLRQRTFLLRYALLRNGWPTQLTGLFSMQSSLLVQVVVNLRLMKFKKPRSATDSAPSRKKLRRSLKDRATRSGWIHVHSNTTLFSVSSLLVSQKI